MKFKFNILLLIFVFQLDAFCQDLQWKIKGLVFSAANISRNNLSESSTLPITVFDSPQVANSLNQSGSFSVAIFAQQLTESSSTLIAIEGLLNLTLVADPLNSYIRSGLNYTLGEIGAGSSGFGKWNTNWCHFVYVYDGKERVAAVYRNGIKISGFSTPIGSKLPYPSSQIKIGANMYGTVKSLLIYDRPLNSSEVSNLYSYEKIGDLNIPRVAKAVANLVNGFLVGVTITDGGYGYTNNPSVSISGGGGSGAAAVATQVSGVVTGIRIIAAGSGYTENPLVTIEPPPIIPRRAIAICEVANGFVVDAKIIDGGFGYKSPPTIKISDGNGAGATAVAVVENGQVTKINIINSGSGYTKMPSILIGAPYSEPKIQIEVSRVRVKLKVTLGVRYQLESSVDMKEWIVVGNSFVAEEEEINQEYAVDITGRYFRITETR
jgi:hypothetical protein